MQQCILDEFERWKKSANEDPVLALELEQMQGDYAKIEDAFYRQLEFGTGGLRGVIGAGTNRMNIYTVARASQGLANYINISGKQEKTIAICFDSRINSELFAKQAAGVFAANGIKVYIFSELMPTPCLSYAVRTLHCDAGVVVTASHNPAKYNGYKVYGPDGCQITSKAAKEIYSQILKIDLFTGIHKMSYDEAFEKKLIENVPESVIDSYVNEVKAQELCKNAQIDRNIVIVYSPLNGTGLKPVLRVLKETGYTNVTVVAEQEKPDGHFPTCPFPNPEEPAAMELGIRYAEEGDADLIIATDPDCDRVGIAVKDILGIRGDKNEYVLLSGNETGVLLLDYVCARRKESGTMPEKPVAMKTIVTTDLARRIADSYGVRLIDVLTGFKYIGEQIGILEERGLQDDFVLGIEESCGYLSGSYVRDKDGVNAALLICEMTAYYKTKGINLVEKLDELYQRHGYTINTLYSYTFEGSDGVEIMEHIMEKFRAYNGSVANRRIHSVRDYSQGIDGLPKSNVLKFEMEGNCSFIVRPSGTEPKIKVYISASGKGQEEAYSVEQDIKKFLTIFLDENR